MRPIDADKVPELFDKEYRETMKLIREGENHLNSLAEGFSEADKVIREMPTIDQSGTWIPVSSGKLPVVETEVWIYAKRKYGDGSVRYITTTAMYEDGTMSENDSEWLWYDLDKEYDEERGCYIIPEGWWEYRHYNVDEVFNNCVCDEVIAWMPLPKLYKGGNTNE